MVKRAFTPAGISLALLLLSGAAAFAGTPATNIPAPAPQASSMPAPAADAPAAPGDCTGEPTLASLLKQEAPLFTPAVQADPHPAATVVCSSCTIVRGCFSCPTSAAAADKAPCAITICCGVETNRICGTCSDHCVPPPA